MPLHSAGTVQRRQERVRPNLAGEAGCFCNYQSATQMDLIQGLPAAPLPPIPPQSQTGTTRRLAARRSTRTCRLISTGGTVLASAELIGKKRTLTA